MKNIPKISFNAENAKLVDGFELIVLEDLIASFKDVPVDHDPFMPHRLTFFIILIITEGEVQHSVDFEKYTLKAGEVMVISKGQIHAFNEESNYKGNLILFTEEFMQKYIASSTIAQINHLYNYFLNQGKITNPDNSQEFLNVIKKELTSDSTSLPNIVGAILSVYLLKLNDENVSSIDSNENRNLDYFNNFRLLVESNFSKTRDAKDYASELSISYKLLNYICKEFANNTAKAFIDSYVILESKRMLVTTSLSVKEVAFDLGFDEVTNFTKFFKKHTGETPSQFYKKK